MLLGTEVDTQQPRATNRGKAEPQTTNLVVSKNPRELDLERETTVLFVVTDRVIRLFMQANRHCTKI